MATNILKTLFQSCRPIEPALPTEYVDASEARGENSFVQHFLDQLKNAASSDYLTSLLSGHVGCGKSSELRHLNHRLRQEFDADYVSVFVDTKEYLNEFNVKTEDLLLAVAAEVADTLRVEYRVDLSDTYFVKKLDDIRRIFMSDVQLQSLDLSVGPLKAPFRLLATDKGARERVRAAVEKDEQTLLSELNSLLSVAQSRLNGKVIVLIIDNLERVKKLSSGSEGGLSLKDLFIENSNQLAEIRAHKIFTVPLPLCRSDGPLLGQLYGRAPYILPMVKVFARDHVTPFEKGRKSLESILRRRAAGRFTLEEAFDRDALDWIISYTGGSIRSLMTMVQEAATYADEAPIPLKAAKKATGPYIQSYSTSIPESYWQKLAKLELSKNQEIDNLDQDFQRMLEQLIVLEYLNGADDDDTFVEHAPWYAVHPVIRELGPFKRAVEAARGT